MQGCHCCHVERVENTETILCIYTKEPSRKCSAYPDVQLLHMLKRDQSQLSPCTYKTFLKNYNVFLKNMSFLGGWG